MLWLPVGLPFGLSSLGLSSLCFVLPFSLPSLGLVLPFAFTSLSYVLPFGLSSLSFVLPFWLSLCLGYHLGCSHCALVTIWVVFIMLWF